MAVERTLSIIKPDATRRNKTGAINAVIEDAGLRIVAPEADRSVRRPSRGLLRRSPERPFFRDLVTFMMSGPVVVQVLEGENAVAKYRDVMGATNPANAAPGTIRKLFAELIEANSVHGSDLLENAQREIAFFFNDARDRRLEAGGLAHRQSPSLQCHFFSGMPLLSGILPPPPLSAGTSLLGILP